MDSRQQLNLLFNLNFLDSEQNFYLAQKESLLRGIRFSILNGQLINYLQSNQLISNEETVTNYLLVHAFYLNKFSVLRGKLCKILVFPEDELLLTFFHKEQIIYQLRHQFDSQSDNFKISARNLSKLIPFHYHPADLAIEVKLLTASKFRLAAEQQDFIWESDLAWDKCLQDINQKMEVLAILHKKSILNERIKLWGFTEFQNLEQLNHLGPLLVNHKDVFLLSQMNYHFMQELSNSEILSLNALDQSYLAKAKLLAKKLQNQEIIWVSNR